jgi:hypothetical protein
MAAVKKDRKLPYPGLAFRILHQVLKRLKSAQKVNTTGACNTMACLK